MKRRHVISRAIGMTGTTAIGCSISTSQKTNNSSKGHPSKEHRPTVNWRMATSWPSFLDVFKSLETLCQRVAEMTDGGFVITPYPGREMVEPLGNLFEAVQKGESNIGEKVHCGHTALYYFTDINPALAFGASVPFGLNTQQQHAWLYSSDSGVEKLKDILQNKYGLVWFPAGNTTGQMGGWFRKPINDVTDLQGLKMRIPGLGQKVLECLGVKAVTLPAQDIVQAFINGDIDAVEWIGPNEDETLELNKIARYYYYPGWWEPGTSFAILINQSEWNQLPEAYQTIFQAATMEANLDMLARYNASNRKALKRLISKGIDIQPFSEDFLKACKDATIKVFKEQKHKDFQSIYDNWQEFRNRLYNWQEVSSLEFSKFAYNKEREPSGVNKQDEIQSICLNKDDSSDDKKLHRLPGIR